MSPEALKIYGGDTSNVSQAKSILKNHRKDKDHAKKYKKGTGTISQKLKDLFKENGPLLNNHKSYCDACDSGFPEEHEKCPNCGSDTIHKFKNGKLNEEENNLIQGGKADRLSIEDIAKKHKVSIEAIEKQIEKGISVESEHVGDDKARAREISMDHLAEFPDYYDRLNSMENKAEKDLSVEKQITTAPQVGLVETFEVRKQTLTSAMSDIRVDYAKGIVDSIKLYSDLITKASGRYDMEDLSIKLEHHLEEDNLELEEAISILDEKGKKEVLDYQKEINTTKESEDVDLSQE